MAAGQPSLGVTAGLAGANLKAPVAIQTMRPAIMNAPSHCGSEIKKTGAAVAKKYPWTYKEALELFSKGHQPPDLRELGSTSWKRVGRVTRGEGEVNQAGFINTDGIEPKKDRYQISFIFSDRYQKERLYADVLEETYNPVLAASSEEATIRFETKTPFTRKFVGDAGGRVFSCRLTQNNEYLICHHVVTCCAPYKKLIEHTSGTFELYAGESKP